MLSAAGLGSLLQPAQAILDLLLVLRLGQLPLRDLNQLGRGRGLEKAFDEAHEFSKVNGGQCAMTGGTLRRLQELAAGLTVSLTHEASDEGGESGGLPVRVQLNTVHSTIVAISKSGLC
jgi:hypothetical protein